MIQPECQMDKSQSELLKLELSLLLEQENRNKARESLIDFTVYTKPDFKIGEHHQVIAHKLEQVERGEIDRLMIFAPPRHTKSELASRRFPAWYLGRNPNKQIITSTYSGEFASDFGRDVRDCVASQEYKNLFETKLREDSKAANRWQTEQGGIYVSVGVGGPITGRGADIALIDDPVKNREDADSEVFRDKVWNWYTSTLYTRLMPGGAIVLILTRWHEDDLAGRILERERDQWEVVNFEAIQREGTDQEEALWPEWYPLPALHRIKNSIGARDWNALYQQRPQPEEGIYFHKEWFNRYEVEHEPKYLNKYGASDYAVTEDGGDYTEHGIGGFDHDSNLYILDWWSGQKTADVWIEEQLDLNDRHRPLLWAAEAGPIRRSVEPFLTRRMQQRRSFCRLEWIPTTRDKPTMCRSFQALASQGKVYIPDTEWGDALIDQLLRFPTGTFDDKVDVMGLFGRILDQVIDGKLPGKPEKILERDYSFNRRQDNDWKTV